MNIYFILGVVIQYYITSVAHIAPALATGSSFSWPRGFNVLLSWLVLPCFLHISFNFVSRNSRLLHLMDWKTKESGPVTAENLRSTPKASSIFSYAPHYIPAMVTFPAPTKFVPAPGPLLLQFPLPGMLFLQLLLFIIPVSAPSPP